MSKQPARRRRRGSRIAELERLERLYASAGGRRGVSSTVEDLASCDPLFAVDRDLALRLYQVAGAPRPSAAVRRALRTVMGDGTDGVIGLAREFKRLRRWSNLRCAEEAVALSAQRGAFVGTNAACSFGQAVKIVRAALEKPSASYRSIAATGGSLMVKPAENPAMPGTQLKVRDPLQGDFLLPEGRSVPNDLYWRRLLLTFRDIELVSLGREEKKATI